MKPSSKRSEVVQLAFRLKLQAHRVETNRMKLNVLWGVCTAVFAFGQAALASDHEEARGQPAASAYHDLVAGNQRFVEGTPKPWKADAKLRGELAKGQKPKAIVLSCSDSRVPPELVFDQTIGEVFPIRVAGNVLGAAQVASIEYALSHLGTNLIVVMGHESCGAVKAALATPRGQSTGSIDLDSLIASVQSNLDDKADAGGRAIASADDKTLRKPVMQNVDAVAEGLVKRSKIVRDFVATGQVKVVRGVYSLETGKVDFWSVNL